MSPKPLRVNITVRADSAEAAVEVLSGKFLKATRTGCSVATKPTDYPAVDFCTALIEDWRSGKVPCHGEITLSFSSGELDAEADLLIYRPEGGERLVYSRRATAPDSSPRRTRGLDKTTDQLPLPLDSAGSSGRGDIDPREIARQLYTLSDALAEFSAHQRSLETRFSEVLWGISESAKNNSSSSVTARQFQELLDLQATTVIKALSQQLSEQIAALGAQLHQRLDQMQHQIEQRFEQLEQLTAQFDGEEPVIPQTEAEWLQRIQDTWGTVGDYEQYSASHREANAESPLFETPDWVAICELDWIRKLSPPLAVLYSLIHEPDGIGYAGADILQQFGCHVDPRTGDRYYIYQLGGFSAYEALWKTVSHPQHSWLPELRRLSQRLTRHPEIFQMFGWQKEAIAALEQVIEQASYEKQSSRQSGYAPPPPPWSGNTLSDYLVTLNLGPFAPITLESLKRAYKQAMKTAHPDTGGSKEQAQRVNEAYEAVLRHYFPNAI
jgi:hypothetical protein